MRNALPGYLCIPEYREKSIVGRAGLNPTTGSAPPIGWLVALRSSGSTYMCPIRTIGMPKIVWRIAQYFPFTYYEGRRECPRAAQCISANPLGAGTRVFQPIAGKDWT